MSRKEALGQVAHRLLPTGRWEGELVHATRDGRELVVVSRWARQARHESALAELRPWALQLGTGTVKSDVERLLQQLGASSRAEAAARAATWGVPVNQRR